ncbi:MAG: phosphomannomutase/phosphoglucomutase [Bacilli bacterium]|nr:phosphomannomutase/phosphoglucomutase [Bacilli bacterium]
MNLKKINENIFREYDVRGIYGTDLDEDVAYTFGRSFATYIQKKGNDTVIVGHDNRESSPVLSKGLIKGLVESGATVIDLGLVTTPMYYFAKLKNQIATGIMITASHNPREYNGFKISFSIEGNACGKAITDFRDFTNQLNFIEKKGNLRTLDIKDDYLKEIKKSIDLGIRKVKVVYDCGNGTGSIIIKDILDMLDIEYDLLYCDSDPTFPNHHPDPCVPKNMIDLGKRVKELGYDLGIGIDGDADRVGLVDQDGNLIPSDMVMLIVYRSIVNTMKNKKAIYDVKCSKTLIDGLKDIGVKGEMARTGNSYMNLKINQEDFDFGGEYSGHLWFRDKWMGFDDGIYAGLRLIEILSKTDKKVSELLENTNQYYATEELKFSVSDDIKFNVVEQVKEYCKVHNYKIITVDGVRCEFDDSWALVRASNTGPNITARFEANNKERLNNIQKEFIELLKSLIKE